MNYRTVPEDQWNCYFEHSRTTIPSVCPDFSPKYEEYCKKKLEGWKTFDDKVKHEEYVYFKNKDVDVCAFHFQVKDMCLISPKGIKKWFEGCISLYHIQPECAYDYPVELVMRMLQRTTEFSPTKRTIKKIVLDVQECPSCKEDIAEDPSGKVDAMD